MNRLAKESKAAASKMVLRKRKAEISPVKKNVSDKRSALGEVTNMAGKAGASQVGKGGLGTKSIVNTTHSKISMKPSSKAVNNTKTAGRASSKVIVDSQENSKSSNGNVAQTEHLGKIINNNNSGNQKGVKVEHENKTKDNNNKNEAKASTASSSASSSSSSELMNAKNDQVTQEVRAKLPDGVIDFDQETADDPYQVGLYAADIFEYYKKRELRFPIKKYLEKQTEINRNMRSILVDWMVEVQESFELNHETLYLAVKLVDMFLSKIMVKRDKLQLLGTTAMYLAAKYDERCPPVIDDFCYICDDAYPQKDVIKMEMQILKTLDFDIGVPLSYRFLRRYARCTKLDMETLTLARYILETSLTDYDFIDVRDSMIASACLMLARSIKEEDTLWNPTLEHYSGYKQADLTDLCQRLFNVIQNPHANLKTIRAKYSHNVFYSVAKIPLPEKLTL